MRLDLLRGLVLPSDSYLRPHESLHIASMMSTFQAANNLNSVT